MPGKLNYLFLTTLYINSTIYVSKNCFFLATEIALVNDINKIFKSNCAF